MCKNSLTSRVISTNPSPGVSTVSVALLIMSGRMQAIAESRFVERISQRSSLHIRGLPLRADS
jgi:hypothetical protein